MVRQSELCWVWPTSGPQEMYTVIFEGGLRFTINVTHDLSTWGAMLAVLTGPDAYMGKVQEVARGRGYQLRGGALWHLGERVGTETEQAFFTLAGVPHLAPQDRGVR